MQTRVICGAVLMYCFGFSQHAEAHIDLQYPPSRGGSQKTGPCEGVAAGGPAVTLRSGSKIDIRLDETVAHPGHFRVMFDSDVSDGEDFPDPTDCNDFGEVDGVQYLGVNLLPGTVNSQDVCYQDHLPIARVPARHPWVLEDIQLPDIECDNCAIQVIQVMIDKGKHPSGTWNPAGGAGIYFRCANVRLSKTAPVDAEPAPIVGGNPPVSDAGSTPEPGTTGGLDSGGCQSASGGGGPLAVLLLALYWIPKRAFA